MPFIDCSNSFQNNGLKHGHEMKVLTYIWICDKSQVGTHVTLPVSSLVRLTVKGTVIRCPARCLLSCTNGLS